MFFFVGQGGAAFARVSHYVFFGAEREQIHDPVFCDTHTFAGAQIKYTWRELEPEPDKYDFHAIREDVAFLTGKKKRLFVQLQDVTFSPKYIAVQPYLLKNPRFHGGADKQYEIPGDNEARAIPAGWVARRWDRAVRELFHKLLAALGREFDGKIEGINLAETAVEFGTTGRLYPKGFTPSSYRDGIIANMVSLKKAFPKSVTMVYANFMPGEWLPDTDRGYLQSVYRAARKYGVGVGGPDLKPYKKGQMQHSYSLIRASAGIVPTGIAVQEGNYEAVDAATQKAYGFTGLLRFATEYLHVNYIFWGTQKPFFDKLILFLNDRMETKSQDTRAGTKELIDSSQKPEL